MRKRILSFLLALSMVVSLLPAGAFAETSGTAPVQPYASSTELVMEYGKPKVDGMEPETDGVTYKGDGWEYNNRTQTLTLTQTAAGVSSYDFGKVCPTRSDSEDTNYNVDCAVVVGKNVTITGGGFYYYKGVGVINNGIIAGGSFDEDVTNNADGIISGGEFEKTVTNNGIISGGVFFSFSRYSNVVNNSKITGGIFQWGLNAESTGTVTGGCFGSKTGLPDNFHKISMNSGIICKVGDVYWGDHDTLYTVEGTQVQLTTGGEIEKITGNTTGNINFTQNYYSGGWYTVTFTMPDEDVVLKQKSSGSGELVMSENGYPIGNAGDGWTFENTRLYLTSGSYDFSYLNPTNPETGKEQTSRINVAMVVGENVTITGGRFYNVTNYGTISNGTFSNLTNAGTINGGSFSEVTNTSSGTITDGNANGIFNNYGTIAGGTFESNVINYSTIKNGQFNGYAFNYGVVENGIFTNEVENYAGGTIQNGIFTYRLYNSGTVTGGYFKSSSGVSNVFKIYIDPNKINTVYAKTSDGTEYSADWNSYNLYAAQDSTVTLTANVEIGTINGEKIGEEITYHSSYVDGDKKTITFTMPGGPVNLKAKTYNTALLIDPDTGKPDTTDVKVENGVYVGDGWKYDDSTTPGKLTLTSGDYDFTKTGPATHSGSELKEVNCEVIVGDGVTIKVGTFNETVTNHGNIEGGIFVKGLSDESTNESGVTGGYFRTNTGLPDGFYSLSVDDGKIIEVNSMTLPGGTDGWEECFLSNTYVIVKASVGIATINGEKIGSNQSGKYDSYYDDGYDLNKVCFEWLTTGREDIVLGKAYRTELVMKADGTPDTDGVKQNIDDAYVGDGWMYDGTTLTLNTNPADINSWDFTNTKPADGSGDTLSEVNCEVVVNENVILKDGTFNQKVTNYGTIEKGTFNEEVVNNGTIKNGTFEKKVTNGGYGRIYDGIFKAEVTNNGAINGGTFKETVTNHGSIEGGIFAAGLSENTGSVYGGYFGSGTKLPEGFYSITVPGGKITEINDQDLTASVPGGWEKCFLNKSDVTVTADVGIATINGEKINSNESGKYLSDYVDISNKKQIYFYFISGVESEDIVLGKIHDAPLVMKNGYPDVDVTGADKVNGVWYGDGWEYDGETLTLTAGTVEDNYFYVGYDFTKEKPLVEYNWSKAPADETDGDVNCKVVVRGTEKFVALTYGTFHKEVTLETPVNGDSVIRGGTYESTVTVKSGAEICGGTFEGAVINEGEITESEFHGNVTNYGTIGYENTFTGIVTNTAQGTIESGIFAAGLSEDSTGAVTGGYFGSKAGLPENFHAITVQGGKITEIDDNDLTASVRGGWTMCVTSENRVWVKADVGITNVNGKTLEEFGAALLTDGTITFIMPDEDVVLNKAAEPAPKPEEPKPEEPKAAEYTIKVDEYAKVNGKAEVTVKAGDTVSLTVSETPDGQTFDHWDLPSALQEELTKQDSTFNNNVQNLSFRMPKMGDEDAAFSIKTGFRSAELPADDEGPSALGTAAIVAAGGATAGILVWQGVSLGVDSYLQLNLPDGVPVPTNRRELVKLLWEEAGKPEVALPALYNDISAEELELQKASRWAVANGLVGEADDEDASRFDPDHYVTKMDVFGAWLKLKKLLKNQ